MTPLKGKRLHLDVTATRNGTGGNLKTTMETSLSVPSSTSSTRISSSNAMIEYATRDSRWVIQYSIHVKRYPWNHHPSGHSTFDIRHEIPATHNSSPQPSRATLTSVNPNHDPNHAVDIPGNHTKSDLAATSTNVVPDQILSHTYCLSGSTTKSHNEKNEGFVDRQLSSHANAGIHRCVDLLTVDRHHHHSSVLEPTHTGRNNRRRIESVGVGQADQRKRTKRVSLENIASSAMLNSDDNDLNPPNKKQKKIRGKIHFVIGDTSPSRS